MAGDWCSICHVSLFEMQNGRAACLHCGRDNEMMLVRGNNYSSPHVLYNRAVFIMLFPKENNVVGAESSSHVIGH